MQQCLTEADCRDMIQIEFSEEDIQQLNYERYHHPHPRVQKKMEVLYLKSRKLSHQEIRRLCQISKTTKREVYSAVSARRNRGTQAVVLQGFAQSAQ